MAPAQNASHLTTNRGSVIYCQDNGRGDVARLPAEGDMTHLSGNVAQVGDVAV